MPSVGHLRLNRGHHCSPEQLVRPKMYLIKLQNLLFLIRWLKWFLKKRLFPHACVPYEITSFIILNMDSLGVILHRSKWSLTSSQATTVGPSHWAKGKPFLLASSNSSCLRGAGTEEEAEKLARACWNTRHRTTSAVLRADFRRSSQ